MRFLCPTETNISARWPSWDGRRGPAAECWWTVCSTACPQVGPQVAWQTLSGTSTRHTWAKKNPPMSWSFPGSTNVTVDTYLKKGRCNRSLKTNGDEICRVKKSRVWNTFREWYWIDCSAAWRTQVFTWYGKLATHTSKNGRVVFSTSPTNIWSLACMGLLENAMPFN